MEIGTKLKTLRRGKGFSQESLAEASGISIRTIQRIEKGLTEGSAFTLNSLAKTLDVDTKDLISEHSPGQSMRDERKDCLQLMNLSALGVLFIPFFNLIIPAIIFWKNRNYETVNRYGRRILSFQILWTVGTLALMLIIPAALLLLFKPLQGGGIPLAIPVYFLAVLFNAGFTIRIGMAMNDKPDVIETIPNIL